MKFKIIHKFLGYALPTLKDIFIAQTSNHFGLCSVLTLSTLERFYCISTLWTHCSYIYLYISFIIFSASPLPTVNGRSQYNRSISSNILAFDRLVDRKIAKSLKKLEYWRKERIKITANRMLKKTLALKLAGKGNKKERNTTRVTTTCTCHEKKNEQKSNKKSNRKRNSNGRGNMNCFHFDKYHWKTPPLWTGRVCKYLSRKHPVQTGVVCAPFYVLHRRSFLFIRSVQTKRRKDRGGSIVHHGFTH